MKRYIVFNHILVCQNSKFKVFFKHIKDDKGFEISDFLVVSPKCRSEKGITGISILPVKDENISLLKVYRPAIMDFLWEVPRGFIKAGEDEIDCARRELNEETNLDCKKEDIYPIGFVNPDAGIIDARIKTL